MDHVGRERQAPQLLRRVLADPPEGHGGQARQRVVVSRPSTLTPSRTTHTRSRGGVPSVGCGGAERGRRTTTEPGARGVAAHPVGHVACGPARGQRQQRRRQGPGPRGRGPRRRRGGHAAGTRTDTGDDPRPDLDGVRPHADHQVGQGLDAPAVHRVADLAAGGDAQADGGAGVGDETGRARAAVTAPATGRQRLGGRRRRTRRGTSDIHRRCHAGTGGGRPSTGEMRAREMAAAAPPEGDAAATSSLAAQVASLTPCRECG